MVHTTWLLPKRRETCLHDMLVRIRNYSHVGVHRAVNLSVRTSYGTERKIEPFKGYSSKLELPTEEASYSMRSLLSELSSLQRDSRNSKGNTCNDH